MSFNVGDFYCFGFEKGFIFTLYFRGILSHQMLEVCHCDVETHETCFFEVACMMFLKVFYLREISTKSINILPYNVLIGNGSSQQNGNLP